ncbi:hypothetical protein BFDFBN_BFDFBN_17500, partial [Dysosmobacter welbionis]
ESFAHALQLFSYPFSVLCYVAPWGPFPPSWTEIPDFIPSFPIF